MPWNILDVSLVFLIIFAFLFVIQLNPFGVLTQVQDLMLDSGAEMSFLAVFILQEIIFLLPVLGFTVWKYRAGLFEFGFKAINFFKALLLAIKGYLIYFVIVFIVGIISTLFEIKIPGFQPQERIMPFIEDGDIISIYLKR